MRLLLCVLLCACSSNEAEAPADEPVVVAEPPEDVLARVDIGPGALQRLHEALESPMLQALLPASPSELMSRVQEEQRVVDDGAPVRVALLGEWREPRIAVGYGTNGRRDSWVARGELGTPQRAWLQAVHAVAQMDVHVSNDAMPGLRRVLERAIDDQLRMARAGIRREAARHDEPPAYGDPRALVDWVAERLRSYVELIPDLRDVKLEVEFEPLRVGASMRAVADAEQALQNEARREIIPPPAGAALAWWRASPRTGWTDLLETTAGDRLSDAERELVRATGAVPGEGTSIALGHHDAPYLVVRSPHEAPDLVPVLNLPHVRRVLSMFRCERVRRVEPGRALCAEGPTLHFASNEGWSLTLTDGEEQLEPSERATAMLPVRASGYLVFDATHVAAASTLWRAGDAQSRRDAPAVLSWEADTPLLLAELRFAAGSVAAITDAAMAASDP